MAAVAQSYRGSSYNNFASPSGRTSTSTITTTQSQPQSQAIQQYQEPDIQEESFAVLFCRALYDYEAQDASALSFRRDDIIEVLTQQPSGWWDGLLGEERGWFPSNYVTIISEEEAEQAFSGSDFSNGDVQQPQPTNQHRDSIVDMSHAMMGGTQAENEEWLDSELSNSHMAVEELAGAALGGNGQTSDFWMPQVAPNGQIFYVNTQTGQQSRDLPREADDEISDGDLAGLASQSSSRSGTSAGLGLAANGIDAFAVSQDMLDDSAGFGLIRRTGTPEPWKKKLADDGMSFYYYNTVDGSVQWARPEPVNAGEPSMPSQNPSSTRIPTESTSPDISTLQPSESNGSRRLSVYSDSSDIQPIDSGPVRSLLNGHSQHMRPPQRPPFQTESALMQLTSAERIAQSLQQALAPPPPDLLTELSAIAKGAIKTVIDNIQLNGVIRRPEEDQKMDELIFGAVLAVRNLLYVSAAPTGQIPSHLIPREARDSKSSHSPQSPLKPAQRKVTATLSRLVLSARAMQYDSGSSISETLNRIEVDAEELERAVLSFVLEVQRIQHSALPDSPEAKPFKRLCGVFATANIGLGLVGAGAAGNWKGFGWVSLDDDEDMPSKMLGTVVMNELESRATDLDFNFSALRNSVRAPDETSVDHVRLGAKDFITEMSAFLNFVSNIHVARHVDIDGIRQESTSDNELYSQTVEKARTLVRTLEAAVQSLYDDTADLLLSAQSVRELEPGQSRLDRDAAYDYIDVLSTSLKANLAVVQQTFQALLAVGHDQADMAQGDYNGSIEWRMSRLSVIDNQFGGAVRPTSSFPGMYDMQDEDVVDFEMAFSRPTNGPKAGGESFQPQRYQDPLDGPTPGPSAQNDFESATDETMVAPDSPSRELDSPQDDDGSPLFKDDVTSSSRRPARGGNKLRRLMGDEISQAYLDSVGAAEILIDPDGSVRGGTVPRLVERLTAHEHGDPTFIKSFLMTFKSFTTLDELFELLVQRFWIQPPPNLTPPEREDWVKLKQHVIQMRVLNIFKALVVEPDILEKEDLYILDRMKEFMNREDVFSFTATKTLLAQIDRAQKGGSGMKIVVNTSQTPAPPPVIPKGRRELKLLDIDALELARQLTLFESALYQKITPTECLQRAREQKTENMDNIAMVIQTSNRIADWVAESVLSKEDSRRRANTVKHLISVADRCRTLNNFSTMIAITSGLNTPPIRRLKRTWEQVSQRYIIQFNACEMTIDVNKNFNKYRSLMATVNPPCVPFIGVFLSTLQFIQDGNPDNLAGGLVNFRKRQKASEVISDIKRWQAQSFNFVPVPSIQTYIEESLSQFSDTKASSEHFWSLSLEREPREREDEKMARLLQESGFL